MNIEEYISSGILETYVLGELAKEKAEEVEQLAEEHPEIKDQIRSIESMQEKILMAGAVAPRRGLQNEIWKGIETHHRKRVRPTEGISLWYRVGIAASITLCLLSSYFAFFYYSKWRDTAQSLSDLIAQNQQIAREYNRVSEEFAQLNQDLGIINNPAFKKVDLISSNNNPVASVYWNSTSKEVFLNVVSLSNLDQEKQYQLWAIIDGQPVDAGVFDSVNNGLIRMKIIGGNVQAFAITVEPRGGRPSPTLETMQGSGEVG